MNALNPSDSASVLTQKRLIPFLLLLVATLLAYAPALNGELLWDDAYLVGKNPFFRSPIFALEVFRHYLVVDSITTYYRPVQNLTYMIDYWIWNRNVFGYHLANIVYHATAAFLLFRVLCHLVTRLSDNRLPRMLSAYAPFGIALLWAVHPVHNAGVAYISGRADSLAAIFALGAWLAFIGAEKAGSRTQTLARYGVAAALALLALVSKEIAVVWMALFAIFEFFFTPNRSWKRSGAILAGVGIVIGACLLLRSLPPALPELPPDPAKPLAIRFMLMLRALGDYTWLMFYPDVLRMERMVFNPEAGTSVELWRTNLRLEYLSLIGAAAAFLAALACIKNSPGRRLRLFGAVWFLAGFLPISNLIPLNAQVAEHWIYMPSAGFLLFLAGCLPLLPSISPRMAATVFALAVVGLTTRTAFRAADWADPVTFYSRTIQDGGGSARIFMNLATAYFNNGDLENAEKLARITVRRHPENGGARLNLGAILMKRGKIEEGTRFLKLDREAEQATVKRFAYTWMSFTVRAREREAAGDAEGALALLDEGLSRFPGTHALIQAKAALLQKTRGSAAALPLIEDYVAKNWWRFEPRMSLGRLQYDVDRYEEAVETFKACATLDVHAAEPLVMLGRVEASRGNMDAAIEYQKQAVAKDPLAARQLTRLAQLYYTANRTEEADAALVAARTLASASLELAAQSKLRR